MAEQNNEELAEGTLLSHLVELRSRLFKIFGAVFIVFLALLPFAKPIFNSVAAPLVSVLPNGKLLALSPVSPLTATIALTFYLALFIAMPVILYQVWAFVAPGLYRKEKRFAFPMLATSIVLIFIRPGEETESADQRGGNAGLDFYIEPQFGADGAGFIGGFRF